MKAPREVWRAQWAFYMSILDMSFGEFRSAYPVDRPAVYYWFAAMQHPIGAAELEGASVHPLLRVACCISWCEIEVCLIADCKCPVAASFSASVLCRLGPPRMTHFWSFALTHQVTSSYSEPGFLWSTLATSDHAFCISGALYSC